MSKEMDQIVKETLEYMDNYSDATFEKWSRDMWAKYGMDKVVAASAIAGKIKDRRDRLESSPLRLVAEDQ